MPHPANIDALAALLYRSEHWELGIAPPFERLSPVRREEFRRRARFLSARGVVVPEAVAADLHAALAAGPADDPGRLRELLEEIARSGG